MIDSFAKRRVAVIIQSHLFAPFSAIIISQVLIIHPSLSPLGVVNWPKTGLLKTHQALWSESWMMRMSNINNRPNTQYTCVRSDLGCAFFIGSFGHLDDYEGGVFELPLDDYEGGIFTSLPVKSSGR